MKWTCLTTLLLLQLNLNAQESHPLYDGKIPGAIDNPDQEQTATDKYGIVTISKISRPTITVYLPPKKMNSHTAIIIFPGGGYWVNAIQHEGHDVAKYLASKGIAAFVVKYRIPDPANMENPETAPLQDAEQAIGWVRSNAKKYKIRKNKIGVMGFSAGGHLASTLSTHYRQNLLNLPDVRPDFSVLIYPVISFNDSICHKGSREKLLGKDMTEEKIRLYSNELQVDAQTPPAFLAHAKDDPIDYRNSVVYADALKKNHVPAELLLFEKGGHGFGMINKKSDIQWPDALLTWMKKMKYLK